MKQKRLKSILAFLLVFCMVFSVQANIVFAQENDDSVVQKSSSDAVTDTEADTDVTDTEEDTNDTVTTENDSIKTETEKGYSKLKRSIAPTNTEEDSDDGISPQSNDDTMNGTCGAEGNEDNVTWKLEQNNQDSNNPTYTLTISGTGAMADYKDPTSNATTEDEKAPWYKALTPDSNTGLAPITNIVIGNQVTGLGNYAFAYTSVTEADFVPNVTDYGDALYLKCTNLTTVDWKDFNPQNISDGWVEGRTNTGAFIPFSMFDKCANLNSCKIGETAYPVGKLVLPDNITAICTAAFRGTAFSEIDFSDGLENVAAVGFCAFQNMASLTEVTIPADVEFYGVEENSARNTFGGSGLTKAVIEDGVTEIPVGLFYGCSSLIDVEFPDSLETVGSQAFCGCTALTSIKLGKVTSIGNTAFHNCENLKTVEIEGSSNLAFSPNSVFGSWGGTYPDAAPLEYFKLENGTLSGAFSNNSKTTLQSLILGDGVTSVPNNLCSNATNLTTVELGDGLTTIGTSAFYYCSSLTDIDFPDSLKEIGNNAFLGCVALSSIRLGEATSIGANAFHSCSSLNSVKIKGSAELEVDNVFGTWGSSYPSAAPLELFELENGKITGFVCTNKSTVKAVVLGNGVTAIADYAFSNIASGSIIYTDNDTVKNLLTSGTGIYSSRTAIAVTDGGTFANDTEFNINTLAIPTKANYKFLGWYDNGDFTGTAVTTTANGKIYYAKWEAKTATAITINSSTNLSKPYDGKAVSLSDSDCEVEGGTNRTVTFSYQMKDESGNWKDMKSAPTDAGEYRVKAVVAENDEYASAESEWKKFTISKAEPNYEKPDSLTAIDGQTLADVKLPSGFTWQDDNSTSVGSVGTHTFKVTYTPEDTENYNIVKDIEVTLTVNPKMETLNAVPTITATDKTLAVGDTFNPLDGVSASDTEDGDLTGKITVESNTVDTNTVGTYTVTYKVTDNDGASCTKTIYVTVNPKMETLNEVPVINAENKTITVGDTFDAKADVTATDTEDGDITKNIEVISNSVDTSKAGTYEVTYKVTDSQGASVTKTITVTVNGKDVQKPTTDDNKKPSKTDTDKKPANTDKTTSNSPKTGDNTNMTLWGALVILSGGLLAVVAGIKRKRKFEK